MIYSYMKQQRSISKNITLCGKSQLKKIKCSNSNMYMYTVLLYIIKCFYVLVRVPPRKMLKTIHMLDVVSLGLPQGSSG